MLNSIEDNLRLRERIKELEQQLYTAIWAFQEANKSILTLTEAIDLLKEENEAYRLILKGVIKEHPIDKSEEV